MSGLCHTQLIVMDVIYTIQTFTLLAPQVAQKLKKLKHLRMLPVYEMVEKEIQTRCTPLIFL
mgnify:CR=1 FL=1